MCDCKDVVSVRMGVVLCSDVVSCVRMWSHV